MSGCLAVAVVAFGLWGDGDEKVVFAKCRDVACG